MSGYYRYPAEHELGMAVTLGESFSTSTSSNSLSLPRSILPSLTDPSAFSRTNLPPAVVNVPEDHVKGYLHQKKVNHYLVGNNLGEGSFAKVKEAFHILVGEKVAMKVIDKKKAQQDPYVAKNFRREARLLQMVRHPNILQLLEVIETDTSFYLVTELCSGGELMNYIYKKGRLDEKETRKYMRHIVSAVDHLHKAGIIHRDLKVENLLLDANMDIKLIDFGLSNEEFVQGENGVTHCNTQCGSPAYAAPELLGHKHYGPQVDIWSIGVNMYAMLTGCLPYTVEPFNITALHAKMLENKMNPIPEHLSKSCKDLLKNLLKSNPEDRMKMSEIMKHPWMNEDHTLPFGPARYPNRLQVLDLDNDIVQHMVHILKIKGSEDELRQELISNRATQATAAYHLLSARLARYEKQFKKSSLAHTRYRNSRVSRDHGYSEGDDDDIHSVTSMPTQGPSRHSSRTGRVPGRRSRHEPPPKDLPISNPSLIEVEEEEEEKQDKDIGAGYNYHRRRSTMPEMMLKDDMEALRKKMRQMEEGARKKDVKKSVTHPNHVFESTHRNGSDDHHDTNKSGTTEVTRRSNTQLAPIRPVGSKLPRSNYSTPSGLNYLRQELDTHLGHHNNPNPVLKEAWQSNPTSRNASRQASRHSSRHPSGMTRTPTTGSTHARTASFEDHYKDSQPDDITFHEVTSKTLPRSFKSRFSVGSPSQSSDDTSTTLPSITSPRATGRGTTRERTHSTWGQQRTYSESTKNGYLSQSAMEYTAQSELDIDEVVREIQKVAHSLKIRDVEKKGLRTVLCTWNGVKIKISVAKELGVCKLTFFWISGGDISSYNDKREKIVKKIKL